jgi:hypothetical protein
MDGIPLDPGGLLNPLAAAAMAGLLAQWLKAYLPDWRYTNVLVLVLAVAVELCAAWLAGTHAWWSAVWIGFVGASIATFGYEAVMNLFGLAGAGPRTKA